MTTPTGRAKAMNMPSNVQKLIDKVLEENPMHRRILTAALEKLTTEEFRLLDSYLSFWLEKGLTVDYLAEAYNTHTVSTVREQSYFQKHGKYRYSSFAEVADEVYFNNEFMSLYMYGLAIATFFWANHIEMLRFFRETIPRDRKGSYLEIGPGHGYYIAAAMNDCAFDSYLGIDISETSIEQTRQLVEHYRKGRPSVAFSLQQMDFLETPLNDKRFDAVFMGEVLEHVEQPGLFMREIRRVAKDDAYIHVSTCINAAVIDHIYLFNDTKEIENLFDDCGLKIKRELILPYAGMTIEETMEKRLPVSVSYVLEKN
ncbi:MAG: methyltransferase domain-containing protein [Alphaproteobacteria bacterium]|nr:methyltransferase domain-containing protein [Alphaproteobacteria bacterium]